MSAEVAKGRSIWYVYKHLDGDEVVYVGMGVGGRAFEYKRDQQEHVDWVLDNLENGMDWVEIVKHGLNKSEATKLEAELCRNLQPKWNKIYNKEFHSKHSKRMEKLWEHGVFDNRTSCDQSGGKNHRAIPIIVKWNDGSTTQYESGSTLAKEKNISYAIVKAWMSGNSKSYTKYNIESLQRKNNDLYRKDDERN